MAEDEIKLLKSNKGNRYYYKHREEILEKKRLKKMEDSEYMAKVEMRSLKKAEREALEKQRALKRERRKKVVEELLGVQINLEKLDPIVPTATQRNSTV